MDTASSLTAKRTLRPILVVGNKTQSLQALSLLLQRFGYAVTLTTVAEEAMQEASENRPALIIVDMDLLGMTGIELFLKLRRTTATASIPVILMIPPGDAFKTTSYRERGIFCSIMKPVQADELYRSVQSAIEPRPRASLRIDARLPVAVNDVPLECDGKECQVGLSLHGMYVPLYKPYPRSSRITVRMSIKDRTISAEGSVLYCYPLEAKPSRRPGMGLKFVTISPQDQEFIGKYIRDEVTRDIAAALSGKAQDAG